MARKVGSHPTMSLTEDDGVGNEISLIRRVDYLISQGETFLTNSTPVEVSPEFGEWLTKVENFLKEDKNKLADEGFMVKINKLDELYRKGKSAESLVAEENAGETSQGKLVEEENAGEANKGGKKAVVGMGGVGDTDIKNEGPVTMTFGNISI